MNARGTALLTAGAAAVLAVTAAGVRAHSRMPVQQRWQKWHLNRDFAAVRKCYNLPIPPDLALAEQSIEDELREEAE